MSVAFATKCWEKDWEKIIFGGFKKKYEACEFPFDWSIVVINNVLDQGLVRSAVESTLIGTQYTFAHPDVVQEAFNLSTLPNVYAKGELASLKSAGQSDIDYLCYVQGDCVTQGGDWVTPAIKVLESEPGVMVVSPLSEVNTWHDASGYDHYMSDQAFVVRVKDFLDPEVYAVGGTDPDYPGYGGDSFEALVGKYLKKTGKKRKILTEFWTHHPAYDS